jgi:hypothetical protein
MKDCFALSDLRTFWRATRTAFPPQNLCHPPEKLKNFYFSTHWIRIRIQLGYVDPDPEDAQLHMHNDAQERKEKELKQLGRFLKKQ